MKIRQMSKWKINGIILRYIKTCIYIYIYIYIYNQKQGRALSLMWILGKYTCNITSISLKANELNSDFINPSALNIHNPVMQYCIWLISNIIHNYLCARLKKKDIAKKICFDLYQVNLWKHTDTHSHETAYGFTDPERNRLRQTVSWQY